MHKVIGVRFRDCGKIYFFEQSNDSFSIGDMVIVEGANGEDVAFVAKLGVEIDPMELSAPLKQIIRKATENDIKSYEEMQKKAQKNLALVKHKVKEMGLEMSVVNLEPSIDGNKIIVNFTAEDRVDFRDLLKELASLLKSRIELRQIGSRDETKILGGLGPCGMPCCCKRFLKDFEHVSVKMAKNQNLSLNPTKISGLCGRLMCCLAYENNYYVETMKVLPKITSRVMTPEGYGQVVSTSILKKTVKVRLTKNDDTSSIKDFPLEDISFDNKRTSFEECNKNCGTCKSSVPQTINEKSTVAQENTELADNKTFPPKKKKNNKWSKLKKENKNELQN